MDRDKINPNKARVFRATMPLAEMKAQALSRSEICKPVGPNGSVAFFPPEAELKVLHWPKL